MIYRRMGENYCDQSINRFHGFANKFSNFENDEQNVLVNRRRIKKKTKHKTTTVSWRFDYLILMGQWIDPKFKLLCTFILLPTIV